jgi:hypothetical protein
MGLSPVRGPDYEAASNRPPRRPAPMTSPRHHVFLSYNSTDRSAVDDLARRLVREGIDPWLDQWNLIPGNAWQPAIERALVLVPKQA